MNRKAMLLAAAAILMISTAVPQGASAHSGTQQGKYTIAHNKEWNDWQKKNKQYLDAFKKKWQQQNKHYNNKYTAGTRVAADKASLSLSFAKGDKADSVTKPLDKLPATGKKGSKITWTSSNPAVISNDGKIVNRPAHAIGDVKVVMIATIIYGNAADYKVFELTVKAAPSDAQAVEQDKAALAIAYAGKDKAESVTKPLKKLPDSGENGTVIKWASANPAVLSHDGKTLNRPDSRIGDVKVVMIATITKGTVADTRLFELTVKSTIGDDQLLAQDKAALAIIYGNRDKADNVTKPLRSLPAKGKNGSVIKWTSSNPGILSNDGKVLNRPDSAMGDVKIFMVATLTKGNFADSRVFELTVKATMSDAQKVALDKAALTIGFGSGDQLASVTRPLDKLPAKGDNGSAIVWYSSNPAVLSNDGKALNRPAYGNGDTTVVMSAVLTSGQSSDMKTFTLVIKQQVSDVDRVNLDKAALAIGFNGRDNANSVTRALSLPVKGDNGSVIVWYSSAPNLISNDGKTVNRPAWGWGNQDQTVTLTAVITSNNYSDTRTFQVIVKKQS